MRIKASTAHVVPKVSVAPVIGYSCKDNDQTNKPFPVSAEALTSDQLRIQKAYWLLKEHKQAFDEAKEKLQPILSKCKHEVFHDVSGWTYDDRYCVLCGAAMGFI